MGQEEAGGPYKTRQKMTPSNKSPRSREWSLGLFFLCCVVVLWVLSSFLLNDLFEKQVYSKPFLITWFNTASFSLYLVPYYVGRWRRERWGVGGEGWGAGSEILLAEEASLVPREPAGDEEQGSGSADSKLHALTFRETLRLSLSFCILWFSSNFFNNASLLFTSVSSQTILSSTSSFFTMLVGYLVSQETFNTEKILSLAGLFVGVLCVTLNDEPQTSGSTPFRVVLLGDMLALLSALCYGVYSILLKLKVKDDSRIDMRLFFGFVGVFNIVFLWPSLLVVHYLKLETFELPPSGDVWFVILFNCMISFLADFLWARAMLLTSPLTVTVGLCLTIPLALICDVLFKFKLNSPIYFFGAFLVCFSFYWINKSEQDGSMLSASHDHDHGSDD